jgi:hypothetical protein
MQQTAPVHERCSASYSASGKPRLRSYLRRCFAEISARTQYPAPNPKKNTARINKDDMKSFGVAAIGSGQRGIRAKVLQQRPLVAVDQMNSIATHTMKYSQPAVAKPMAVR